MTTTRKKYKRAEDYRAEEAKAEKTSRVNRALVLRAENDPGPEGDIARDMLAKRSAARQALAVAEENGDIEAMREVAAFAAALQKGAKARGMGIEAENEAAEVVIRAERAIGKVLLVLPREPGGLNSDRVQLTPLQQALSDLNMLGAGGTGKGPNATAQRLMTLARLSDEEFESILTSRRAENERIAKVDFYRAAQDYGRPVEAAAAIQKLIHEDEGPTSPVPAFKRAAEAVNFQTLTTEELVEVAAIIQTLAAGYTAEKKRRTK